MEQCFGGGVDFVVQQHTSHGIDGEREDVHPGLHVDATVQANRGSLPFEPRHTVVGCQPALLGAQGAAELVGCACRGES